MIQHANCMQRKYQQGIDFYDSTVLALLGDAEDWSVTLGKVILWSLEAHIVNGKKLAGLKFGEFIQKYKYVWMLD